MTMLIFNVVFSISAFGYDVQVNGIYYNLLSKAKSALVTSGDNKYTGDVVIPASITVEGVDYNVTSIENRAFYECRELTSISIPNSVTSIGEYAFYYCSALSSISIPNSVKSIGRHAFNTCKSLTSISIPNSVTTIEPSTFYKCSSLTSVSIPNSVTSILDNAFSDCGSLNSVSIPNSVKTIGSQTFLRCSNLTSITIPNSVTTIGDGALQHCSKLTSVSIPNSVTSIGGATFNGCSSLTSITIPNSISIIPIYFLSGCSSLTSISIPSSITRIEDNAFKDCTSLKSISIPNSVTRLGSGVFTYCISLASVTIPNSVTYIDQLAFSECRSLKSISIPNSVSEIAIHTFNGCSSLTSVSIPNSITRIGYWAFSNCTSLTSISIPKSVTFIGNQTFSGCKNLENVYCYSENVPGTGTDVFKDAYIEYAALHVPIYSLSSYQSTSPWSDFGTINALGTEDVTISKVGVATYCSQLSLDVTNVAGVKAYVASEYNAAEGKITMTRVNEIPAGTGFILKGSAGTYTIPVKSTEATFENLLMGTVVDTEVPATSNGYDNYILGKGEKGVAFYKSSGGTLAANKAYLRLPASGSSSTKAIRMSFDDDATTEILLLENENTEETVTSPVYDLNGMQKSGISNGWNIVNGKKILIKK